MAQFTGALALAGVVAFASIASAQGEVSQDIPGHGKINWTDNTITATGTGAPDLKAPNAAVARLGAERVARMDALRNILEAVKGAKISGTTSAGGALASSPQLSAKVQGAVSRFKVLDTKYYSDGGVDIIVQVPLSGVTDLLLEDAGSKVASGKSDYTGLIINAKGLPITPALAPRLLNESGEELYTASFVAKRAIRERGVVRYTKSLDQAMKDARVAGKPLILKAKRLSEKGSADLVLENADATKLATLGSILGEAKVIIVID